MRKHKLKWEEGSTLTGIPQFLWEAEYTKGLDVHIVFQVKPGLGNDHLLTVEHEFNNSDWIKWYSGDKLAKLRAQQYLNRYLKTGIREREAWMEGIEDDY